MAISDRIKEAMADVNMSGATLARKLDMTSASVSKWRSGEVTPPRQTLASIAEALNVSEEWLKGENVPKKRSGIKYVKVPILGTVRAGMPTNAIENIIGYEEIPLQASDNREYFALEIKGDSMYPTFMEKDIIVVRKQESADTGDVVVALIGQSDATIKRLKRSSEGIELVPINTNYDVLRFSNENILNLPVAIVGKVTKLIRDSF